MSKIIADERRGKRRPPTAPAPVAATPEPPVQLARGTRDGMTPLAPLAPLAPLVNHDHDHDTIVVPDPDELALSEHEHDHLHDHDQVHDPDQVQDPDHDIHAELHGDATAIDAHMLELGIRRFGINVFRPGQ